MRETIAAFLIFGLIALLVASIGNNGQPFETNSVSLEQFAYASTDNAKIIQDNKANTQQKGLSAAAVCDADYCAIEGEELRITFTCGNPNPSPSPDPLQPTCENVFSGLPKGSFISDSTIGNPGIAHFVWPNPTPPGLYTFQSQGVVRFCPPDIQCSPSDIETNTIRVLANQAPTALAAVFPLNSVVSGTPVILDGTGSHDSDPDDFIASYSWSEDPTDTVKVSPINNANTKKGDPNAGKANFIAPLVTKDTAFNFLLSVTDSHGAISASGIKVTVKPKPNLPPVAKDQFVSTDRNKAKQITLMASDPEKDRLTYFITSIPQNGKLSIESTLNPIITYTPAQGYSGPDSFKFKVNDGTSDSNIANVGITVLGDLSQSPRANAGPDQTVSEGKQVRLDGSKSTPQGTLEFSWAQKAGPTVRGLTKTNTANPEFIMPNLEGISHVITFELTVKDKDGRQSSDRVDIRYRCLVDVYADVFIQTKRVANPDFTPLSDKYYEFAGDDHVTPAKKLSYRFFQQVVVDLCAKNPLVSKTHVPGLTTGYYKDESGTERADSKPPDISQVSESVFKNDKEVVIVLKASAKDPLVPPAPTVDSHLLIKLNLRSGLVSYDIDGRHDRWPGYSVFIGKEVVYFYDGIKAGTGPLSLAAPGLDISRICGACRGLVDIDHAYNP